MNVKTWISAKTKKGLPSKIHGKGIFAIEDIKKDEIVIIDYGMIDNQDYKMDCICGTDKCRKTVSGHDYKLPEIQKYGKYPSSYIQSILEK